MWEEEKWLGDCESSNPLDVLCPGSDKRSWALQELAASAVAYLSLSRTHGPDPEKKNIPPGPQDDTILYEND